jgi:uncharacterized protein (DUF433 family)
MPPAADNAAHHPAFVRNRGTVRLWTTLTASPSSPARWVASPASAGTAFTVEHLLRLVGSGWTLGQIQEDFPFIEAADIQQAIAYAAFSAREYHLPIKQSA